MSTGIPQHTRSSILKIDHLHVLYVLFTLLLDRINILDFDYDTDLHRVAIVCGRG
jgi:hypothetical protein